MTYDDTYWKNYSSFIDKVEHLTNSSPLDLLNKYNEFAESLEEENYNYDDSAKYELDYDILVRSEIEKVLNEETIKQSELYTNFKEKIDAIDIRVVKFLNITDEKNWWKNPKLK